MSNEEINYKDLTKKQLDYLKDLYIESRVFKMSEDDLKLFVRTIITDQIKETVGNEEEREAWKEMKEHFQDEFASKIKESVKKNSPIENIKTPEKDELEKRIEILENRKQEKSKAQKDMW
tara:strand:+ start:133 stop:492 length:360 start_codon:yes stop_codon:yes gene_type:complete